MPVLRFLVILLLILNLLALAAWRGWLGEGDTRGEPERITNQLRPERIHLLSQAELSAQATTLSDAAPDPEAEPAITPNAAVMAEPAPEIAPTGAPRPEPAPPAPVAATPEPPAAKVVEPAAPDRATPKPDTAVTPPATETTATTNAPPRADIPPAAASPPACVAFAGLGDDAARVLIEDARARRDFETRDIASTDVDAWWVILPSLGGMAAAQKRSAELRAMGITEQYIIPERGSHPYGISLGLFRSVESANEQRRELMARGLDNIQIEARGTTTHRVEVRGPSDRLSEWASRWTSRQARGSRLSCRP